MKSKLKIACLTIFAATIPILFASCEQFPDGGDPDHTEVINEDSLSVRGQKQLNVIYFLPNDVEPYANYEERLSGLLVHAQEYFAEQLDSYGFGYRRFGLEEHDSIPGFVKIHLIHAEEGRESYPYSTGGSKAKKEINKYFNENPHLRKSEHFLVFIPRYDVGVPFYGLGKYAFMRDYENGFDMSKWEDGIGFPTKDDKWIGGFLHELGHGLNLPHNSQKETDDFIALMNNGNQTYWKNPNNIKLTKSSALTLRANEIFNVNSPFEYYVDDPSLVMKKVRMTTDSTEIKIAVKFTSEITPLGIAAHVDPKTTPNDKQYNAPSWTSTNITFNDGVYSAELNIALNGIKEDHKQYPFTIILRHVYENGIAVLIKQDFEFENGIPILDVDYEVYDPIDRSSWSIEEVSHEDANYSDTRGLAQYMLDGDNNTVWHTGNSPNYLHPHHFVINMGNTETLKGISITQHGSSNATGKIKDFTVYTSTDNITFTEQGSYTALPSSSQIQQFKFDTPVNAKYFKVVSLNSYNDKAVTRVGEIGAF